MSKEIKCNAPMPGGGRCQSPPHSGNVHSPHFVTEPSSPPPGRSGVTAGREQDARETLRALSEAATPGPWTPGNVAVEVNGGDLNWTHLEADDAFVVAAVNYVRAALLPPPPATTGAGDESYATCPKPCSNPIEHARYCLPAPASCPPATDGDRSLTILRFGVRMEPEAAAGMEPGVLVSGELFGQPLDYLFRIISNELQTDPVYRWVVAEQTDQRPTLTIEFEAGPVSQETIDILTGEA